MDVKSELTFLSPKERTLQHLGFILESQPAGDTEATAVVHHRHITAAAEGVVEEVEEEDAIPDHDLDLTLHVAIRG